AVDQDLTGGRRLFQEEKAQQRGLSSPGGARQEDELPRRDPEGDVDQRLPERAVFLADREELDHEDPSARVRASLTAAGSARPPVFFMTWPKNQPKGWVFPERDSAPREGVPPT